MVATGAILLARLRLYAVVAKTTETAEQLVKGHMGSAPQLSMQQTSKLLATLGTHLTDLSEELLQSDDPAPANAKGLAADQPGMPSQHLPVHLNLRTEDACVASFTLLAYRILL